VKRPLEEITGRLEARRAAVVRLDRVDARVGWSRLAVFALGAAIAWLAFVSHRLSATWIAAPVAGFLALAVFHDRVLGARARARRAVRFHEDALARMSGKFAGRGTPGDGLAAASHPYAEDLDLFGHGSLFELLCTARTRAGEERLAAWLLHPAPAAEVRARQRAVALLAPRLDLREDLAVLGEDVRAAVDPAELARWAESAPLLPGFLRPAALALALAAAGSAALWAAGLAGPVPLVLVLLAEWALGRALRDRMSAVLGGVEHPAAELRVLSLLLARLEREPLDDPRLGALQAALQGGGAPASARIARLVAIVARFEWARNQLFAPVAFALAWTPLHAVAVERWRTASGRGVRRWLEAVAELEALSSVAGYAYEHPDDTVPEILDLPRDRRPVIEGEALRHPLLRDAVPNDVRLGGDAPRVLLVSGSNMSGKSTYLRTVGVNVVLALAGAPVHAARLRLTPAHAGATLRIQDSLQAGRSRFYAEITRLKALVDLAAGPFPLLFLLDEILHGTNSHDRRIGAEAIVTGLLERSAIGLVTTHDLALTELAAAGGALANAHFEDQVRDGEIVFDYLLRPGVVRHSNALALMRAVGLEV
jgi:MutS domain V